MEKRRYFSQWYRYRSQSPKGKKNHCNVSTELYSEKKEESGLQNNALEASFRVRKFDVNLKKKFLFSHNCI